MGIGARGDALSLSTGSDETMSSTCGLSAVPCYHHPLTTDDLYDVDTVAGCWDSTRMRRELEIRPRQLFWVMAVFHLMSGDCLTTFHFHYGLYVLWLSSVLYYYLLNRSQTQRLQDSHIVDLDL